MKEAITIILSSLIAYGVLAFLLFQVLIRRARKAKF